MTPPRGRSPFRYVLLIVGVTSALALTAYTIIRRLARQAVPPSWNPPSIPPDALPLAVSASHAVSANEVRPSWQQRWRAYRTPLTLIVVALIGTGMCFAFAGTSSTLVNWGDGFDYWGLVQGTHDSICADAGYCTPAGTERYDLAWLVREITLTRRGAMPVLFGVLLTVLPNEHNTIYILHFLMMGISSALISHLLLRLRFPFWTAVLAGLLNAFYVPAIINAMTIFQQPLIRFTLILSIWAYAVAFTASKRFTVWAMCGVGTVSTFILSFSSFTTRPLMWIIPGLILLLSLTRRSKRSLFWLQLTFVGIQIACLVWIYQVTVNFTFKFDPAEVNSYLLLGVSPGTSNEYLTTVRSFADFWAPSEWGLVGIPSRTESLWLDFTSAPVDFIRWFNYSLFSNWRYPDHALFQTFILSIAGQHSQHTLLLILGLTGAAFWSGLRGIRRLWLIPILTIGVFLTAAYSAISVEPRRIGVLMPFVIAAAAVGIYAWSLQGRRQMLQNGALLLVVIGVWAVPIGMVKQIIPMSAGGAQIGLALVRCGVLLVCINRYVRSWSEVIPRFGVILPRIILYGTLILLTVAQFQDQEWRMWKASINTAVRQEVRDLQPVDGFFPWLLIDNDSPTMLAETQISVNGAILKPAGTAMHIWEAGTVGIWYPYVDLMFMSNFPTRRMWYAYPLSPDLDTQNPLTITIETVDTAITLRGDYANDDNGLYDGPSFEPWMSGHSFWRWQWNGDDPRIPQTQSLSGQYVSSVLHNEDWDSYDLSSEIGRQDGSYRIFVIWSPLGSETNALLGQGIRYYQDVVCPDGWSMRVGILACPNAEGDVEFFAEGGLVGKAPKSVFQAMTVPNRLLYQIDGTLGRIDLIQVMNYTYLANYYLPEGELYYSFVFEKAPPH